MEGKTSVPSAGQHDCILQINRLKAEILGATTDRARMAVLLRISRALYEEAKIMHNEGLVSFQELENIRRPLEELEKQNDADYHLTEPG